MKRSSSSQALVSMIHHLCRGEHASPEAGLRSTQPSDPDEWPTLAKHVAAHAPNQHPGR
jgi:hypothetical protein